MTYHFLGKRINGELVRYQRPLTEIEFLRIQAAGLLPPGVVIWHIAASEFTKPDSLRVQRLRRFRVLRQGIMPVDPIKSLKHHYPAQYKTL